MGNWEWWSGQDYFVFQEKAGCEACRSLMSFSCSGTLGAGTLWCSQSISCKCLSHYISAWSAFLSVLLNPQNFIFGGHHSSQTTSLMEFIESLLLQKSLRFKPGSFQTQIFQQHEPQTHLVAFVFPLQDHPLLLELPPRCFPFPITSHPSLCCVYKTLSTHSSRGGGTEALVEATQISHLFNSRGCACLIYLHTYVWQIWSHKNSTE